MNRRDVEEERASNRLRQRLWGAAVLIAIAVIVLPLLLDGSGSESQFRRVERLREEPPRVVGEVAAERNAAATAAGEVETREPGPAGAGDGQGDREPVVERPPIIRVGEDDPPDYFATPPVSARAAAEARRRAPGRAPPNAWVVQAGSFRDRENAIAVRDQLRRGGFATFVSDSSDGTTPLYRVQVGPVVDERRAEAARAEVVRLLGREAIVVGWP